MFISNQLSKKESVHMVNREARIRDIKHIYYKKYNI